jgi:hypothetical protein
MVTTAPTHPFITKQFIQQMHELACRVFDATGTSASLYCALQPLAPLLLYWLLYCRLRLVRALLYVWDEVSWGCFLCWLIT